MKSVCEPGYFPTINGYEKKLIIDILLFPNIIMRPVPAFPAFLLYQDLAKKCIKIRIHKGCSSISQHLDNIYDDCYDWAVMDEQKPEDVSAAFYVLDYFYNPISKLLKEKQSTEVFSRVKDYYQNVNAQSFNPPFYYEKELNFVRKIDERADHIYFKTGLKELHFYSHGKPSTSELREASAIRDLAQSRLFLTYDYAYLCSEPYEQIEGHKSVCQKMLDSLRNEDIQLFKQLKKTQVANKTLRYLMDEKVGSLNSVIGFEPINPLKLLENLPDPLKEIEKAIDERKKICGPLLDIRSKIKRFRLLIDKIHHKCLEGSIEEAADAKKKLIDSKPSYEINRILLDKLGQFSDLKVVTELEQKLENELDARAGITQTSDFLGNFSIFTSGALLTAGYLGMTERVMEALTGTSVITFVPAAIGRILESSIPHLPGFDIYAAFHKWPKSV